MIPRLLQHPKVRQRQHAKKRLILLQKFHRPRILPANIRIVPRITIVQINPINPPRIKQRHHTQPPHQHRRRKLPPQPQQEQRQPRPQSHHHVPTPARNPIVTPSQHRPLLRRNIAVKQIYPRLSRPLRKKRHQQSQRREDAADSRQPTPQQRPLIRIRIQHPLQPQPRHRTPSKRKHKRPHANGALHIRPRQQVKRQPMHGRMLAQHISQRQHKHPAQQRHLRSSPTLRHHQQRQQHSQRAKVLGVDLKRIAPPIARAALHQHIVVPPELRHHQRRHLLGMQRPAPRIRELFLRRLTSHLIPRSPLGLSASVHHHRKSPLSPQRQPQHHRTYKMNKAPHDTPLAPQLVQLK